MYTSTTDGDARLYKKGSQTASVLGLLGHALMENRNGLLVGVRTTLATGTAEREAALDLVRGLGVSHQITLGADKGYDAASFTAELRTLGVTPHIAQNTSRTSYRWTDNST